MGNIVLLDELTINKIAAGEVIERPASVVKEMVENSIDAGATNITVEIKNGGISYIRVTDNGKGIASDDLEIAFERHATSKIRSAADLDVVKSMGFRGEALASIAAIANVELISKTANQEIGYRVVVEGGDILSKEEAGCPTGTTITVRNLFFNTPVRYKFLRKDYTESGYIEDAMTRIALVHPEIAIKLINTGKTIIQTNGNGDLRTVIYSIYGKDIADKILNVNYEYEDIKITGAIGKPEIARSNRSQQIFFINQRYVKDRILQTATEQAFKGLIPLGKFAFLSLNIEMNPSGVDVNVHPAKLEVRFEHEDKIFKAVYHAIKDTLLKGTMESNSIYQKKQEEEEKVELIINTEPEREQVVNIPYENKYNLPTEGYVQAITENLEKPKLLQKEEKDLNFMQSLLESRKNRQVETTQTKFEENKEQSKEQEATINENQDLNIVIEQQEQTEEIKYAENEEKNEHIEAKEVEDEKYNYDEMFVKTFGTMPYKKIEESNVSIFENIETYQKPDYKIVGIVFNTYIIIEMKNEMYIIDQHAAHERIMYEKIKKNYYNGGEKESQLMLLPDIITLTHKEMEVARENMKMFEKAGFMVEEFGENTIKLSGVPEMCLDLETKEMFLETLDEITSLGRTAKQEVEERFIATVACKAAVKANMVLDEKEVKSLMDKLLELPNPFTCPHGRPTSIKMTKYEIERKFARK
jgi:DNA mismatch repair protein MutL